MLGYVWSCPNKLCLGDLFIAPLFSFVTLGHSILKFSLPIPYLGVTAAFLELILYPADLFLLPTGFMGWCIVPPYFILDVSFMYLFNPENLLLLSNCPG